VRSPAADHAQRPRVAVLQVPPLRRSPPASRLFDQILQRFRRARRLESIFSKRVAVWEGDVLLDRLQFLCFMSQRCSIVQFASQATLGVALKGAERFSQVSD
jgi:hypothetical protein